MDGIEALKRAVRDAGVKVVTYVPGYPVTEMAEAAGAEICVNEKVAMEIALGASATGLRSLVAVKQMGMNLLADPLVISATHTIGSGLVLLVGDDLGPRASQSEMDSRYYGLLAELPVLDPRDAAALYSSLLEAYILSERIRAPVIVRMSSRLFLSEDAPARALAPGGLTFDRGSWELTARGRHQRHHADALEVAARSSEATDLNSIRISGEVGIIASGPPARLAEGLKTSLLSVGYAYPLPWDLVRNFVKCHRTVLVAEEPEPLIELQLRMSQKVRGRLTGHLPFGPLETDDLRRGLQGLDRPAPRWERAEERGFKSLCPGCPFEPLYRALNRIDAPVAGDVGCTILAVRRPLESVDVVYGLGSSIGVASGFGRKGIAVLGDYALAHSGLQGLVNAVWRGREVVVVVAQNRVAATTGGQEAPDLTRLLEALVPTCHLELPAPDEAVEALLKREIARPGASAVVASGRCVK